MGRNTSIKTETTDNFTQLVDNINNQSLDVGATGKLTTTVDSDIVGAINELDSNMGAKTSLTTTDKTNIVNAINEIDSDVGALSNFDADIRDSNFVSTINTLNAKVNAGTSFNAIGLDSVGNDSDTLLGGFNDSSERASLVAALNTLSQDIGKLDSNVNRDDRLTTTASTLFGAINELDSDIGARPHTSLNTTAKTLTGAINENKASLNALAVFRNVATDSGSGSISVTVDSANDTLSILSGGSLKTVAIGGNKIQIDHDVTGASSVNNSGNSFIQDLTIDAHGHLTAVASAIAAIDSAGLQSQINDLITTKQATIDTSNRLDASLIHDGSISNTEFGYLNGVTSAIQTQLNSKGTSNFDGNYNSLSNRPTIPTATSQLSNNSGFLTSSTLASSFSSSGLSGYIRFANGFQMCWARISTTYAGTWTYPLAFPNAAVGFSKHDERTNSTGNGENYVYSISRFSVSFVSGVIGYKTLIAVGY